MLEVLPKIDMPGELDEDSASAKGGVRRQLIHMLSVALDRRVDADALTALVSPVSTNGPDLRL